MKSVLATVMIAALLPLTALAALSKTDSNYLTSAMQSQLGRYALASLAQKNASSASVKHLAASIAAQAAAATRKLDAIAKANGVPVAKGPSVRDSFHYSELSGQHGSSFDRSYVRELKIDDQITLSNDKSAMRTLHDSALRAFAGQRRGKLTKELSRLSSIHV